MHCFNNNYALPAGVSFYSMLEHANSNYDYRLYVLHTDITPENQAKLQETISGFKNASLEFINMGSRFDDLFLKTNIKSHYAKEMFYKFLPPSLFPQYDKIIITDVDVVWLGDISLGYFSFETSEDIYLAGHRGGVLRGSWLEKYVETSYGADFTKEEIEKLSTNACYWIFNLKKMRADGKEREFIEFATENAHRIRQPEQDVINMLCFPKIRHLPFRAVVCTYIYDLFKTDADMNNNTIYSAAELREGMENPVQLHYATHVKPWKNTGCTKSEEWFKVLVKTPFLKDYLMQMEQRVSLMARNLLSFKVPFLSKTFALTIGRTC